MTSHYDAIIVGSGPNGLAAGIVFAQKGLKVLIYESDAAIGGGMRSSMLTLEGCVHDHCAAILPLAVKSPFFSILPLQEFGLEWIFPPIDCIHPFDSGEYSMLTRSIEKTAASFSKDAKNYQTLMTPLVKHWDQIAHDILGPFKIPKYPIATLRFAVRALQSAERLWQKCFTLEPAKAFFAGMAGHSLMPLNQPLTSAFALVLICLGHLGGWPIVKGGTQKLADSLTSYFRSLGGTIETNAKITNIDQLPQTKVILCDVSPKTLIEIAGHKLSEHYKKKIAKFRYGPGIFKIDWALHHPIPWKNNEWLKTATLHLGATSSEIKESEESIWLGKHSQKPFVILAQPTLFDPTRAPEGKHTAWGYCHVPNESDVDMTEAIENQVERFAPGFKDCILARSTKTAQEMEAYNPNYVGGDINGGLQNIWQLFSRPAHFFSPYATSLKNLYLCSSSTPPGGGVHGMCGFHAAHAAYKKLFQ